MPKRKPQTEQPTAPTEAGPTCGQCRHWRQPQGDIAECFFYPPRMDFDDEGMFALVRPWVPKDEPACGQFVGAN